MGTQEKALLRRALRGYQKALEAELAKPPPSYGVAAFDAVQSGMTALVRVPTSEGLDDGFRELYERELGQVRAMLNALSE